MRDPSQFNTDRTCPGQWTITFSNPPINMFVPTTIVELGALLTDLEADPSVKVVVFQSANPDFFVAHLDVSKAAERPEVPGGFSRRPGRVDVRSRGWLWPTGGFDDLRRARAHDRWT